MSRFRCSEHVAECVCKLVTSVYQGKMVSKSCVGALSDVEHCNRSNGSELPAMVCDVQVQRHCRAWDDPSAPNSAFCILRSMRHSPIFAGARNFKETR